MKVKFNNYWNNRDEDGDLVVDFALIPTISYYYNHSDYGSTKVIYIHFLFWELEFDFNPF